MGDSIRLQAIDAAVTALTATTGISGRCYRSRTAPVSDDDLPCIKVQPADEPFLGESTGHAYWGLIFEARIWAKGDTAEEALDAILTDAHRRLMADRTLGAVVSDIVPIRNAWNFAAGDGSYCLIIAQFQVSYFTNPSDMELPE